MLTEVAPFIWMSVPDIEKIESAAVSSAAL